MQMSAFGMKTKKILPHEMHNRGGRDLPRTDTVIQIRKTKNVQKEKKDKKNYKRKSKPRL